MRVNEEHEVTRIRRERAERLEREAFAAEIDAFQVQYVVAHLDVADRRPGTESHVQAVTERAADLRQRATAAHELAGTSPEAIHLERRVLLEGRLQSIQTALIQEREWAAHPDVYIDNPENAEQWKQERRWAIAELTKGAEALESMIQEVGMK